MQCRGASRFEDDRDREPHERQVHVAIGVRLRPGLHPADHGNQRSEVPEPADDQVRMRAPQRQRAQAERCEQRGGERRWQQRIRSQHGRVGVEVGEVAGPHGLAEIDRKGFEPDRESQQRRELIAVAGGPLRALDEQGGRARRGDEHELGKLLEPGAALAEAAERPVVEQQQDARQCHCGGLREQGPGQARQHEQRAAAARSLGVAGMGVERRHPEDAREDVLARRGPGDGFDVERVHGEQGGDEEAGAGRARHARESQEEQQRGERVQRDVGEQVACGLEPVRGVAGLEREHRERDPIGIERGREGPLEGIERARRAQGGVLEDPGRIVPVDELVATHLSVDGAGEEQERDGEPTANRQGPP